MAADVETSTGITITEETAFPPNRVRTPQKEGLPSNEGKIDLTTLPVIGPFLSRALKSRKYQFSIILPSQILFWLVIFIGIFGIADPHLNFATAITWGIWFVVMFPLTLILGRAWCITCPFGGFGEWIQRKTLWARKQKSLGLGWKMPQSVAKYGLVISAALFVIMTWAEEYFGIADGAPYGTAFMVVGIVAAATLTFLLFERRTFCRYFCPLSSLIGACGSTTVVAGFKAKDREVCLQCKTKDCMRGGERGYGCPWYTYPATADTNAYCGLCSECYKACPYENVSLYAQKPLDSVIQPRKNKLLGWAAALLFGVVIFEQWMMLDLDMNVEGWLKNLTHFPAPPNPIGYFGIVILVAGVLAGIAFLMSKFLARKTQVARAFNSWFTPLMYGLMPIVATDYLATAFPDFVNKAANVVPGVTHLFGSTAAASLADFKIMSSGWLLNIQYAIVSLGIVGSIYATYRIAGKDWKDIGRHQTLVRILSAVIVLAIGVGVGALFYFTDMNMVMM